MDGFNYEIKIENSPFEIGNNSNILKVNMELPPTPKVADFNISFKSNLSTHPGISFLSFP